MEYLVALSPINLALIAIILFLIVYAIWISQKAKRLQKTLSSQHSSGLRNTTAFQDLMLENLPDLVFVKDSDFKIISANPAFMNVYPADMRNNIIGTTTVEQYSKEEAEEFLKDDKIALEKGFIETEETLTFPDGKRRTLNTKKIRFRDNNGRKFILGVAHDITDLKNATAALEQSEAEFRSAIENSPIGMAIVSPTGKWLSANKALQNILGYTEKQLLKIDFQTITHADDLNADLELLEQTLAGEIDTYQMEKRYIHKDGHIIQALLTVALVRDEHDKPKHFISQIQDITERKKAEEEIMRSNEELERFAYIASHDLQEPLRMVRNFTALLNEEYSADMDETAAQYMTFITDASKRMQDLIADLLEYSRVGSEDAGFETFNPEKQLNMIIENLQDAIKETNAKITYGTFPDIHVNPVRFSRLMQNLIGNAIKYRDPEKSPIINIECIERDTELEFRISDNGIGIKEEYLKQIFVIFKRLHNKDAYSGTGIGLAICKKIVESFKGQLWVESEHGKGSTFIFTVPKPQNIEN